MKYALIQVCLFVALTLAASTGSTAHEGRPVYIELTEGMDGNHMLRWRVPPVMPDQAAPVISLANDMCSLASGQQTPALTGTKLFFCGDTRESLQVSITYSGVNPVLSTLVRYTRPDGSSYSIIAGPEERLIILPEEETFARIARAYTASGFDHILEGYDHLLFVFCLVLLVGTFKRTLIAVTGFTIGHSITLGMAATAQWSLPPTFVEPLIAFSVLILATEKASGKKDTLTHRFPIFVAAGFGLLHGFGFGGALAEVGLPQTQQLPALAFFNIGVELGQALFVLVLFAAYAALKPAKKALAPHVSAAALSRVAIYPAGLMAGYWTIERVLGIWA